MGGHTKYFFLAVTLQLYVTGTLARGVGEFADDIVAEEFGAFEFTTRPYDSATVLEAELTEDLEEERRKEEEAMRKTGRQEEEEGCEYDGRWYATEETVKTHEPCLRCKCLGETLVCQLRVCPQVPDIVPQGCYRLKKSGECCEEIVCEGELENNRLYRKETELENVQEAPETERESVHIKDPAAIAAVFGTRRRGSAQQNATKPSSRGCVTEGAVFAEGSAMVSPDECSYCFCIRGKQRCVAPKCLLPVEGCRPRYRSFSCCPSYYDCYDATTTTTTTTTTRSTPRDCEFNGQQYTEGSPVPNAGNECQNCFCMEGKVTCTNACDPPLEGCTPVMEEGHCCPVRYNCDDSIGTTTADGPTKGFGVEGHLRDFGVKTTVGSRRGTFKDTEPKWHRNMARQSPGGEAVITDIANEKSFLEDTPNEKPLETANAEESELGEVTEENSQEDNQKQEGTDNTAGQGSRKRVTQRRRLIGRITRPSSHDIENRRKQSRYPQQRIPPRIRSPQPQRPSTPRPNTRIKFNKGKLRGEERKQFSPNASSKLHPSPESTTKPSPATTPRNYPATTSEKIPNKANELDPTIQYEVDQVTLSHNKNAATTNGPAPGISEKSQEQQNDNLPASSERPTTKESQIRPTRFSQRRSPFLRRRNQNQSRIQNQSLSSILRSRNDQRQKDDTTETEGSTTSKYPTPARVLLPSHSRTTPLLSTTTTEKTESHLVSDGIENTSILPPLELTENLAFLSSIEVTEKPILTTEDSIVSETERETTQTEDYTENDYDFGTTISQARETITFRHDSTFSPYNLEHRTGLFDATETWQYLEDETTKKSHFESSSTASTQRMSTLDPLLPVEDPSTTDFPSAIMTTLTPLSASTPELTTTAISTISTSTLSEDKTLPETSSFGHAGEATLVHDISELSSSKPNREFKVNQAVEVGTGVNVKGDLEDAVAFGPILIFDNRVRVDRQNREFNSTEDTEVTDIENTAATEIPEETTMFTLDEINITDDDTGNGEPSADYETGTDEITTLFPTLPLVKVTTVKSLSELLSQATTEATNTTNDNYSSTPETVDYIVAEDLEDTETRFPSYDITVGTSVLATNQARPTGVGEVIPVDLEPEHKSPEIESGPVIPDESPSLLGTILNILTRTERPRPDRFSPQPSSERLPPPPPPPPGRLPPPPPPPFRPPFRPRPRPDGRPDRRPDFIPPRFRPPPLPPKASERDTTEEPETNTDSSSTIPIILSSTESTIAVNRPVSGFDRPKPIVNIPVHILNSEDEIPLPILPHRQDADIHSRPNLPNRPDFLPNRPIVNPTRVTNPNSPVGLPSKPVIEGGFQAMKDGEGIEPDFDYEYDENGKPTLPPSLPNLKIIPFVAADAVVNQEIGIAGDEFKPPLLLTETSNDNLENQRTPETTEASTTTTTRRPFLRLPIGERRPPILPPRRPISRPGDDDTTTRRPFVPFRRPGDRPTRAPFPFKTKTTISPEEEREDPTDNDETRSSPRPNIPFEDRERPSTRPPFIPPRRPTQTTDDQATTSTPTPKTTTTTEYPQTTTTTTTTSTTTTTTTTTPAPIVSNDISNLLLQDIFGLSESQNTPPVRFNNVRTTPKTRIPIKLTTALPEIPAAVRDQMPLATDPVLASGLLKLSGCNIYGRMYEVGDQIKELSSGCKECRCTHVGVQCLPAC